MKPLTKPTKGKLVISVNQAARWAEVDGRTIINAIARGEIKAELVQGETAKRNRWEVDYDSMNEWRKKWSKTTNP